MRALFLLASVLLVALPGHGQGFDHTSWDRILKAHVTETGLVDYPVLKAEPVELEAYVAQLAARSPASHPQGFPTRESRLAYWINAYNALVIHGVVEHWPVKKVTSIGLMPHSFFWWKKFTVGGQRMTLNHIEHDVIRKQFREPRIHFVLVCAAVSCPRLPREAFTAENLERLLEDATRFFVNEPRNLRIDASRNRIAVARIFSYYEEDFEAPVKKGKLPGGRHPLVAYIEQYANDEHRRALAGLRDPRVSFFTYDWTINSVRYASK